MKQCLIVMGADDDDGRDLSEDGFLLGDTCICPIMWLESSCEMVRALCDKQEHQPTSD